MHSVAEKMRLLEPTLTTLIISHLSLPDSSLLYHHVITSSYLFHPHHSHHLSPVSSWLLSPHYFIITSSYLFHPHHSHHLSPVSSWLLTTLSSRHLTCFILTTLTISHLSLPDSSLLYHHVILPVSPSPLSPSITPSLFHSRLKQLFSNKSFPP